MQTHVGGLFLLFSSYTTLTQTSVPRGETVVFFQNGNHGRCVLVISKLRTYSPRIYDYSNRCNSIFHVSCLKQIIRWKIRRKADSHICALHIIFFKLRLRIYSQPMLDEDTVLCRQTNLIPPQWSPCYSGYESTAASSTSALISRAGDARNADVSPCAMASVRLPGPNAARWWHRRDLSETSSVCGPEGFGMHGHGMGLESHNLFLKMQQNWFGLFLNF